MVKWSENGNGMNESNQSSEALAELLTLTVETDCWESTVYRNQLGQIHRALGPAVISASGEEEWYRNGQRHRTDGPAVNLSNGYKSWYLYDHRLTEEEFNERVKSL